MILESDSESRFLFSSLRSENGEVFRFANTLPSGRRFAPARGIKSIPEFKPRRKPLLRSSLTSVVDTTPEFDESAVDGHPGVSLTSPSACFGGTASLYASMFRFPGRQTANGVGDRRG